MSLSLSLHIIGLVMWIGGLLMLTRTAALLIKSGATPGVVGPACRRVFLGFVIPGMVVMIATGLYQWSLGGFALYMKQGWFHGKLTFVVVLFVITAVFFAEINKMLSGVASKPGKLMMVHGLSALSLIVVTLLTLIGRSGGIALP